MRRRREGLMSASMTGAAPGGPPPWKEGEARPGDKTAPCKKLRELEGAGEQADPRCRVQHRFRKGH